MVFNEFIVQVKLMLAEEGLKTAFNSLKDHLNPESPNFNLFIGLMAEHRELDVKVISGIVDFTNENLQLASIRGRLMRLLDILEETDFVTEEVTTTTEVAGIKELPTHILLAMNVLSYDLARERIDIIKTSLEKGAEKLFDAAKRKDEDIKIPYAKLKAVQVGNIKDLRLVQKYINQFGSAFSGINREMINFADTLDKVSGDFTMLAIYQVQYVFAHGSLNVKDLDDIQTDIIKAKEGAENMIEAFNEKIDKGEQAVQLKEVEANFFGFKRTADKIIESEKSLKQAVERLLEEMNALELGLSAIRSQFPN